MVKRLLVTCSGVALLLWSAIAVAAFASGDSQSSALRSPATGPWDTAQLARAPQATWGATKGLVQEVFYAGEPFQGKPTRVFAYYGRPAGGSPPFPAVLLVHGGGGKAFSAWAEHWAARGYVALAMDLAGHGPAGRLDDGGPDQDEVSKFHDFDDRGTKEMWSYHAVAAVLRGHSLLASRSEVDNRRIAVTGISWGGYLTCIVAGLDDRLKAAVPVYGCGFLEENSTWVESNFSKMSASQRQRWHDNFDPSRYLAAVKCPMLFVNGTNDFAYPLDSYQKSYSLVTTPVALSIEINRPHGHIWTFREVDAFIDSRLQGGKPLARVGRMKVVDGIVTASVSSPEPITKAELDYTTDVGPWQKRKWSVAAAEVKDNLVTATLPAVRPRVYFVRITDSRGLSVSAPHASLGPEQ
jgi:dienelactone hydrolase